MSVKYTQYINGVKVTREERETASPNSFPYKYRHLGAGESFTAPGRNSISAIKAISSMDAGAGASHPTFTRVELVDMDGNEVRDHTTHGNIITLEEGIELKGPFKKVTVSSNQTITINSNPMVQASPSIAIWERIIS